MGIEAVNSVNAMPPPVENKQSTFRLLSMSEAPLRVDRGKLFFDITNSGLWHPGLPFMKADGTSSTVDNEMRSKVDVEA